MLKTHKRRPPSTYKQHPPHPQPQPLNHTKPLSTKALEVLNPIHFPVCNLGSISVSAMLILPEAKGLFQRGIMQSGSIIDNILTHTTIPMATRATLELAESLSKSFYSLFQSHVILLYVKFHIKILIFYIYFIKLEKVQI